jgi:transposase/Pyruvate/2-oxoacid:ferredoxin oxidoreductase delta subunit
LEHKEQELDRHQFAMLALEELVAEDSYARLVDVFVDALPLEEFGFTHTACQKEGRPPYHPAVLLKLYMYGYRHGLRSSSKLHQACLVNVELWWLLKGLKPSARTICYFRHNNAAAFKKAFRHFVLMLKEWKLIDGETIAIDSFKIRAQNSLKENFNQKKINNPLEYIDGKIEQYRKEIDEADSLFQQSELLNKVHRQKKKREAYKEIEKELAESGQSQLSRVDPDARAVVLHRNIVNVGYNVQAGCDSKHKLFVNAQTGAVNDTHALADMAIEAKELLGVKKMNTLTDKGYTTGAELARCADNDITTYSSPKAHSSQKNGLYDMQDFIYDEEEDTYTCPAGSTLHTNGTVYQKGKHRVKHYKTKACKGCAVRHLCTNNKNGRFIERGIHQKALEENAKRVNENPEYYRQRQQITEHQFGTLKRQWGFTHTLVRGKENVLAEVHLTFSVYNLVRCMQILGTEKLRMLIKGLSSAFLNQIDRFKEPISYFLIFFWANQPIKKPL